MTTTEPNTQQIVEIAAEAFLFGYPLVLAKVTRDQMTSVPSPSGVRAPVNQFGHERVLPAGDPVPAAAPIANPNPDMLFSSAWLDLSTGPLVLSVPDLRDRYCMLPVLDAWTNIIATPGTRTTGREPARYAIVGPYWHGTLPEGVPALRSPTESAWILARTELTDDADTTHAIQDGYHLAPLTTVRSGHTANDSDGQAVDSDRIDNSIGGTRDPASRSDTNSTAVAATTPAEQVTRMDPGEFFGLLALLMVDSPPRPADDDFVTRMGRIGILTGERYDWAGLDRPVREAIIRGTRRALAGLQSPAGPGHRPDSVHNGWTVPLDLGEYGTDYARRARVAWIGLGANRPEDAVYAVSHRDSAQRPYHGAHRYTLHFGPGQAPPVEAFWSLSAYGDSPRPRHESADRSALGGRDELRFNRDASLDLHIQHDPPGPGHEPNWLPVPADGFTLALRMYRPGDAVLDRSWTPPAVHRHG